MKSKKLNLSELNLKSKLLENPIHFFSLKDQKPVKKEIFSQNTKFSLKMGLMNVLFHYDYIKRNKQIGVYFQSWDYLSKFVAVSKLSHKI